MPVVENDFRGGCFGRVSMMTMMMMTMTVMMKWRPNPDRRPLRDGRRRGEAFSGLVVVGGKLRQSGADRAAQLPACRLQVCGDGERHRRRWWKRRGSSLVLYIVAGAGRSAAPCPVREAVTGTKYKKTMP